MRYLSIVFTLLIGAFNAGHVFAQEQKQQPPWLQPEVLKAAVQINMTEEQKPLFRQALSDMINNQLSATNRILRRNNVSNLKRKMKTATNRQFKKMDKSMLAFLNEDQHAPYFAYRDLLKAELMSGALNRGAGNSEDMQKTNAALNGFSDSN